MRKDLTATASIQINASASDVWDAMTNPEKIKVYLFGTETITDWKVGSPITFKGEYDGHTYNDKGNVLQNKPNAFLQYNYWAQFSQLEDKPENYSVVTYVIEESGDGRVLFTWKQEGFSSEKGHEHTQNTLGDMLMEIKKLVEEG